ncbi:acyltransferase family protein [Shewanella sp. 10N.286.45.A1]|uniref:acyltransferase family protein n=1 Tax=Shewanella sp. 10N.286.45.A1 TaxID=3229694 RepID=UPI003550798A
MKYRPEIEGLRAISVISVIFFHAEFSAFSGGFVGVDVFFVISGYLITTLILAEMKQETFSLINFYERRARRLLPALFLVMLVSFCLAWLWMIPSDLKDFSESLIAVSTFSSNIYFWFESGYWAAASEKMPLLHTWSLAVEEQYYIFFPLFLMLMWQSKQYWILYLFLFTAGASLLMAHWGAYHKPSATFYLLPTRLWEIAIGASIAFYNLYRNTSNHGLATHKLIDEILGILGLFLISYAIFAFDNDTPFPSFYALVPTVGCALIIIFSSPQTLVGRALSTKPFVAIGLISYSAYLWHQPLLAFARHQAITEPSQFTLAFLAFLSIPVGYISWKYVEKPFRTAGVFNRKEIFSYSILASAFFIAIGISGYISNGFENTWLSLQTSQTQKTYAVINNSVGNFGVNGKGEQDNGDCRFNVKKLSSANQKRILDCHNKYKEGLAILGDSHAQDLFGVVISSYSRPFVVGITKGGCRPHNKNINCQYSDFIDFVKSNKSVFSGVLYEQSGFRLLQNERLISETYEYLKTISNYTDVVWLGPRIEPQISDKTILKLGCDFDFSTKVDLVNSFKRLDLNISNVAKETSSIRFVSQNEAFKYDFTVDFMNCNDIYWSDGNHLSAAGEARFGKRFDFSSLFPW